MKSWTFWIVALVTLAWLYPVTRPSDPGNNGMDVSAFGKLPVQVGGRIKPFDTLARNSLLIINGKQVVRQDGEKIGATQWLLDVMFDWKKANSHKCFLIHNPEVLGLFGWQQHDRKRFSYDELFPYMSQIDEQGKQAADVESAQRSPYQTAILNLFNSLALYQKLQFSLRPEAMADFSAELESYSELAPKGYAAMMNRNAQKEYDKEALRRFSTMVTRYETLSGAGYLRPIPPSDGGADWMTTGEALLAVATDGTLDQRAVAFAEMGDAYLAGNKDTFAEQAGIIAGDIKKAEPKASSKVSLEYLFNQVDPFYRSMGLYVLAFLLACGSWLAKGDSLRRSSVWVLVIALVIHSLGLITRMYLQGRPPVTNLYSSAIFIGWGTCILGLFLERVFKDGIGVACSGAIGFITLVIAHHLASSGDTLEMLQAVLDTNIWLATHVVVITAGYSSMFLAGMIATIYVVRGVFTQSLTKGLDNSLGRMVYGITCFSLLFSFVGTVLGGIWADQSWGRFWGWDPKENGALLIVLWCAVILHARWGGYIRRRGLMVMSLFGNVITSFSWFGVNMLGVGLHSYGFMNKAFPWLLAFVASQFVLMAIAAIPTNKWRSFAASATSQEPR
ncbi:MAG: cytochrome c biogenesis protein CcsA [Akkermansiaceae bacterium]|nr:cytochrome c biogenesis protein CcsA [Akkermansiaceae bacterium]